MLRALLVGVFTALVGVSTGLAAEKAPDLRAQFPDGSYVIIKDEKCASKKVEAFVKRAFKGATKEQLATITPKKYYASMLKSEAMVADSPTIKHGCVFVRPDMGVFFTDGAGYFVVPGFLFEPVDEKLKM